MKTYWENLNYKIAIGLVFMSFATLSFSGGSERIESCDTGKLKAVAEDYDGALNEWYNYAFDKSPKEQLRAVLHCLEVSGLTSSLSESAEWIRGLANRNIFTAQMYLGMMYASGAGVEKNLVEARHWLVLAVSNGSVDAEHLITAIDQSE